MLLSESTTHLRGSLLGELRHLQKKLQLMSVCLLHHTQITQPTCHGSANSHGICGCDIGTLSGKKTGCLLAHDGLAVFAPRTMVGEVLLSGYCSVLIEDSGSDELFGNNELNDTTKTKRPARDIYINVYQGARTTSMPTPSVSKPSAHTTSAAFEARATTRCCAVPYQRQLLAEEPHRVANRSALTATERDTA